MKRKIQVIVVSILMMITMLADKVTVMYGVVPSDIPVAAEVFAELPLNCEAAVLMEASTGQIIYEKNPDEERSPASITKIMTLLLIFEELEKGTLQYDDLVTTSEHAKSMGGSQVFLETGEQQTVETMIKCIVIASGNDASVAMAEHIAGSEQAFVERMNEKARELGMLHTVFQDCCGLWETMEHHSSARDVALMSRELLVKYPQIKEYTKIWMENITHVTKQGSKEFTLSNTNKLIRQYEGATGLKTGSTSLAKYCLSASAMRNGMELIAVVMAAPDYKARFAVATQLLNYGFSKVGKYEDSGLDTAYQIPVKKGCEMQVEVRQKSGFSYVSPEKDLVSQIEKRAELPKWIDAPVKQGQEIGSMGYYCAGQEIGRIPLIAQCSVKKMSYKDYLKKIWNRL